MSIRLKVSFPPFRRRAHEIEVEEDRDAPNEEDKEHLYTHWREDCPRCQRAYQKFVGFSLTRQRGATEFSPRKSYRRFLRKHKTTRAAGRGVRRGLKRGTGFVYHRL